MTNKCNKKHREGNRTFTCGNECSPEEGNTCGACRDKEELKK